MKDPNEIVKIEKAIAEEDVAKSAAPPLSNH